MQLYADHHPVPVFSPASVEFLRFVKLSLTVKTLKCQLTYCDSTTSAISASSAHNRGSGAGITEQQRGREREGGNEAVLLGLAERENVPFYFLLEQSCQPASYLYLCKWLDLLSLPLSINLLLLFLWNISPSLSSSSVDTHGCAPFRIEECLLNCNSIAEFEFRSTEYTEYTIRKINIIEYV